MAARFTYSKWDGTQKGFELDAESILQELTDELLYHGDLNSALRQLMRDGMTDKDGNRIEGLRDMMERIRQRREEIEDSGDLGGVYSEIADALKDILDEERLTIENDLRQAENSGDERRAENARNSAMERNFRLDMMPDDLAGMVREMQHYDFQSQDAQRRFDELIDKLRQQVMDQTFQQMSESMQNMTPQDMARMKDMMKALNEMIEKRNNGQDPGFEKFMDEFGDFFPDNPQTLDELLENMARQMQAAQQMMNSLSPEQRQQLQELSQQLLGDMDLQSEMSQLSQNLQSMFPQMGWDQGYDFNGQEQMGMQQAMDAMTELGDLQQMEGMLRQATNPAQLAEVDLEKVRNSLGDEAANSLEKLAELTKMLEDAGLVNRKEGKLELTPRGLRAIGNNSLKELFSTLSKDKFGQHKMNKDGSGHERSYNSKAYEFGDPFRLDLNQTIRNALRRQGSGTPVRLTPEDFEIEQTEHNTRAATVLMIDLSWSMMMRGNFMPAKKVAMALHSLMSSQFPRDYLGVIGFGLVAHQIKHEDLPSVAVDFEKGTNMQHAMRLARQMLGRQTGTKQIIMITDGEPTSHIMANGQPFFDWPTHPETLHATLREVMRCTKEDVRINSFVLDATPSLRHFIEQMTQINNGRAFFTDPDNLGSYVLVDFLENRRKMARSGR